jgi:hypothetical protein
MATLIKREEEMRRKAIQIMLVLIMLFGLTAWTVGGRAPIQPVNSPTDNPKITTIYSCSERGCVRTMRYSEPQPHPVEFPYP